MRVVHRSGRYFRPASFALCLSVGAVGCAGVALNPAAMPNPRPSLAHRSFEEALIGQRIMVRTPEAVVLPVASEQYVRSVYANFGVTLENEPFTATDSIIESAPMTVGDHQIVYRLRRPAAGPRLMFLEAVVVEGSTAAIVSNKGNFGEMVWKPISAVANHFYPVTPATATIQWLPRGCSPASSMSYCL